MSVCICFLSFLFFSFPVTNSVPILEFEPIIYYGTNNGLHAYSLTTSKTKELVPSDTVVKGVAYDPIRDVIYWSEYHINMEFREETQEIYSGRRDGTDIHFLFNTERCTFTFFIVTVLCKLLPFMKLFIDSLSYICRRRD